MQLNDQTVLIVSQNHHETAMWAKSEMFLCLTVCQYTDDNMCLNHSFDEWSPFSDSST